MCGICGMIGDTGRLDRMSASLVHRGPDSDGSFVDGDVGLAARRLSIIGLETGDQPLSNEDGTITVVQNGEIYNYEELRRELERAGHRFRTHGDTEVLAHAYEEWGERFAERLRGMFAIALWDAPRRRLLLARDRFGIKPLYVREAGGGLEFASELRAPPRGARGAGDERDPAHVLDRLRGIGVRRAGGRAARRAALRDTARGARPAAGRRSAAPRARRRVRRALRGLVGAADLPRLAARL